MATGRAWALRQDRGPDYVARVVSGFLWLNGLFPVPESETKVQAVAESVAGWARDKTPAPVHDWEAQTLRAVKRWHGDARWETVVAFCARNAAIVRDREAFGWGYKHLARAHGVSVKVVRRVIENADRWRDADPARLFPSHYWFSGGWAGARAA